MNNTKKIRLVLLISVVLITLNLISYLMNIFSTNEFYIWLTLIVLAQQVAYIKMNIK